MIRNGLPMVFAIARRHLYCKGPLALRTRGLITMKRNRFSKCFEIRRGRYDFATMRCRVPQPNYTKSLAVFHIEPFLQNR